LPGGRPAQDVKDLSPITPELATRDVLVARRLERIGDNAVDIAEQAVFVVTGQRQEFSDASRPKARRSEPTVPSPG
jgi:phosphate uptake regulator